MVTADRGCSYNKLTPCRTEGRLLLTANFKVTWHKNKDKKHKSGLGKLQVLCPNLRIRGHLPAPIINGGGDSLWKGQNLRLSRTRDLDLGSGHTAYRHASIIDLYLHTKCHWNRRNVLWTDGRTDGRIFETHCIKSTRTPRRPKMAYESDLCLFRDYFCTQSCLSFNSMLDK